MKLIHVIAFSLILASCAAVQPTQTALPDTGFPDDTKLVCYEGFWTIISPAQKIMGVFSIPCGTQV